MKDQTFRTTAPHSTPSLSSSTSPSIISQSYGSDDIPPESPDFVSRVSGIPIVNSAIRAYEHGKASSRVVKVGGFSFLIAADLSLIRA